MLDYGGMGLGLGRGLAENAQDTTPGGLGWGVAPWGGSFKPGVGRASGPMWRTPIRLVAMCIFLSFCKKKINKLPSHAPTQAPPYPIQSGFKN
ncbi:hypothetical protein Hanom_Chr02g00129671 [Helianthus anomalus]